MGYYSAYVVVIWRTLPAHSASGTLTLLAGAIQQARQHIEHNFSRPLGIGDQALFPYRPLGSSEWKPTIQSKAPWPCWTPEAYRRGVEFRECLFQLSGKSSAGSRPD